MSSIGQGENSENISHICEDFIQGQCQFSDQCPNVHWPAPFHWQLDLQPFGGGIFNFAPEISYQIESYFCRPEFDSFLLESLVLSDTVIFKNLCLNFEHMKASVGHPVLNGPIPVIRLSTLSYAVPLLASVQDLKSHRLKYYTQWRWYWYHSADNRWKVFGEDCPVPDQVTLETKFSCHQKQWNYRFESADAIDFVIEMDPKRRLMSSLVFILLQPEKKQMAWPVRRRPLLPFPVTPPPWPLTKPLPYIVSFPPKWTPLDRTKPWEVVKLNENSEEFKSVEADFMRSLKYGKRKAKEIFRLQNPFIWQKYITKYNVMNANSNLHERRLFHGTQKEAVVKGICRHGFDIRCNGVNNTLYGKGAYFAVNSSFSDKYSFKSGRKRSWMFLARVLVGKFAVGNKEMPRPPPLDACQPFGDLYDSCVDNLLSPTIFVVFDSDQCYPEYVIGYKDATVPDSD